MCTPKVRHLWRCIFLWQTKQKWEIPFLQRAFGKVADNLLHKKFYADKPFEKLTTGIIEFKIGKEKVYLSPVLDMFNRVIVAYSISTSPNLQQIRDMLNRLFGYQHHEIKKLFTI